MTKKILIRSLIVLFILSASVPYVSYAQSGQCLGGGCSMGSTQYPSSTLTPTTSWQTQGSIYAGEHQHFNVVAGNIYEFSLCDNGGSCSYDGQLTLYNATGTILCYSDDYSGDDPKILWTATYTGVAQTQVNEYNCNTNSTSTTLAYRYTSGCPVITTQPSNLTICENGSGSYTVATSAGSPTYQWYYGSSATGPWTVTDGVTGLSGHQTATLSLTSIPYSYNGFYIKCNVTASSCTTASNSALLTVSNVYPTVGTFTINGSASDPITVCAGDAITVSHTGWNAQGGTMYYYADNTTGVGGWCVAPDWEIISNGNITAANQVGGQTGVNNLNSFQFKINAAGTYIVHTNLVSSAGCYAGGANRYITVVSKPTITGTTPGSRCGTGTVILGASASAGTINWYAASTGGSSLGTGTSWTTPSISSTTTYYCDATYNGCTTPTRTAVVATVNSSPSISSHPSNQSSTPCGSATFSVTVTGTTPITYQWQVSTNGGSTWTNISAAGSGPTYAGYTTSSLGLTGIAGNNGYQYRCVATNSCGNVTSNAATLTVGYGAPSISGGCGGKWINNFVFAGISNTGTGCAASPYYTYYSGMTATTSAGGSYAFSIASSDAATYYKVWADFNDNYSFEDSGELLYSGSGAAVSGNITIPGGAANGTHRLRVRTCDASSFTGCSAQTYGETEDYKINVCVSPTISVQPANSSICNTSTSFSVTAANVTSYQWQVSTNGGSTWNNITTAGSNPTYSNWTTATLSLSGIILSNDGYKYRCVLTNACTSLNSNSAELTAHAIPVITLHPSNQTTTDGGTATFSGNASGNGLSVQWQVSTNGGSTWTNISNGSVYSGVTTGTLSILNATGLNGYMYHAVVTNNCGSATTNAATLTVNICTPSNSSCGGRYIYNFTYGGLNNTTSTSCTGSPVYYNSYYQTASVTQGTATAVSITSSDASTYFKVWIDYNDNNSFQDAGESVYSAGPTAVTTGNITATGAAGTHKMRVRTSGNSSMTSCSTEATGETEDYLVTVIPCSPATQASNITFSNVYNTKMDVNWTNGSGTNRAVFMKAASSGTAAPVDGTTYTGNTLFGTGTQIGTSGWYCIYNGTGGGPLTITGLSANTTYRVQVFEYNYCPVGSPKYNTTTATNNPNNQATTNNALCAPTSTYYDEYIANFSLNTINNASDSTSPYNGYSDYSALSTTLPIGTSYTAVVTNGMNLYAGDQCGIWIDYNQDQDFTDAGEQIFVSGTPGPGPYTALINPPTSALLGTTKLRVRIMSTGTLSPCGNTGFGETEDYSVNIVSGNPCNPVVFQDACETSTGWTLGAQTSGSYRNKWAFSSCNAIDPVNNSLTVLGSTDAGVNYYCSLGYAEATSADIMAYKSVNASGYYNLKLNFTWKCLGNTNDYGKVMYSTNGGSTWTDVSATQYKSQSTAQTVSNLAMPVACENITFLLGFRWYQNDAVTGNDPPFTVDDIYILGNCNSPLPGPAGAVQGTSQVCAGQTGVMYSVAPITNATGYVWAVPPGASIVSGTNTNTITVNYSGGATSGNVTVYGTNGSGNGTISPAYAVTVSNVPAAAGAISGTASVCEGQSYVYSVSAITGATSYSWTMPTGFNIISGMNTNSVTVNFATNATSGNISVAGTNSCGTGTASANYAVTVNPLPAAAGTVTGPSIVCENSTGVFTVPAITNATGYTWTVPAGASITAGGSTNTVTVSFSPTCPHYGQVSVVGTNGCGSGLSSAPYNFTIGHVPAAAGTITGPTSVCQNTSGYVYSITGDPVYATDYVWSLPAGASIISGDHTNQITVSFAAGASSGNVSVYMSNVCGNGTASTPLAVTVTPTVAAAGTITGTANVCQGQTGVTYSVPAITGATSYVWTLPSGASITAGNGTNSITVSFSSIAVSGNINVYGTNSCSNGTVSANYAVTINQASVAPVSAVASPSTISSGMSSTLSFNGGSLGTGASWAWYSGSCGGTYLGNTQTITVSPTTTTTYYIGATGGSCGATACASVTVTVSSIPIYYGFFNSGARIYVAPNAYMYIDGTTKGDYASASCGGQHGHIDIDGTVVLEGDWYNNNSSSENCLENIEASPDGTCEFRGTTNTQTIGGTTLSTFENVKINNSSVNTGDNIVLLLNLNVNGTLNLTDGVITTGSNYIIINNTAPGAVFNHSGISYVDGNLRRYMKTGAGTYAFPLGYGGHTPSNYYLIDLENSTLNWAGGAYINSKVQGLINHLDADLVALNIVEQNYRYVSMATQAMWTLTPSVAPSSGTYNLKAWITNIKVPASLADNHFAILKRPNGTTGSSWSLSGGTINTDGGLGRMLADDYAYRMGITGFSEISVAKSNSTLPVELLTFSALCRDNKVTLDWSTTSESNSDYFTVERSQDAFLWETLLTVPAAGNSNTLLNYTAKDEEPFGNQSYYRLNQTDFNGMTETFPAVTVNCSDVEGLELINVSSEDAGTVVTFSAPSEEGYSIYLYDDRGNLILEKNDNSLSGFNQVLLSTSYLSRGIYLVVLTDNNSLFTRKIIIN